MSQRLLVPLDGSALAESALPWAAQLARTHDASVVLARVVPWPMAFWTAGYISAQLYDEVQAAEHDAANAYLRKVQARLRADRIPVETLVRNGFPGESILELAEQCGAAAIVMATHGRGGISRLVVGSVAEHVVQDATIPVLLVPAHAAGQGPGTFARILVPLDGSPLAERALDLAQDVAAAGTTLCLVRVVAPVERTLAGVTADDRYVDYDATARAVAEAEAYLHQVADTLRIGRCAVETTVRTGTPGEQILAAAHELSADLVVLATHGRTGAQRWLLGSVADTVVRGAHTAVFMVTGRVTVPRIAGTLTVGDLMTRGVIAGSGAQGVSPMHPRSGA
jgi:nucleotide-binding universal stress UspA family protein